MVDFMSAMSKPPDFPPVRRFTVAEYHQMIEADILGEDDNVELLEGWIIPKMSRKPAHDGVLGILDDTVRSRLPANWKVRIQSAITTADSEPEPDLAVVRGPLSRYMSQHPRPEDIGLVVEVADTSLDKDRDDKGPIYAAAGLPYYWIVNIVEQTVEVYSDPAAGEYRSRTDYALGQAFPLILDGQQLGTILVRDIFAGLGEPLP
jgi:Uma2 family endonuclease